MHMYFHTCILRMEVLGSLCAGGQEGCGRIYRSLSQLHCLCELEEAGGEGRNSPATSPHLLPFLMSWQDRLKHLDADFSYIEPVLSLRASTLHSQILRERGGGGGGGGRESSVMDMAGKRRVEQLFVALSDTLLTLAKTAQDVGSYQVNCHVTHTQYTRADGTGLHILQFNPGEDGTVFHFPSLLLYRANGTRFHTSSLVLGLMELGSTFPSILL